jgi:hypothetical protein
LRVSYVLPLFGGAAFCLRGQQPVTVVSRFLDGQELPLDEIDQRDRDVSDDDRPRTTTPVCPARSSASAAGTASMWWVPSMGLKKASDEFLRRR